MCGVEGGEGGGVFGADGGGGGGRFLSFSRLWGEGVRLVGWVGVAGGGWGGGETYGCGCDLGLVGRGNGLGGGVVDAMLGVVMGSL